MAAFVSNATDALDEYFAGFLRRLVAAHEIEISDR
jgi:hypothetical protein